LPILIPPHPTCRHVSGGTKKPLAHPNANRKTAQTKKPIAPTTQQWDEAISGHPSSQNKTIADAILPFQTKWDFENLALKAIFPFLFSCGIVLALWRGFCFGS